MPKIKWSWAVFASVVIVVLTLATRFFNLSWGLPFPFHPDERNMAAALEQLRCPSVFDLQNCLNPHFYAYGQLPLYLGLLLITVYKSFVGTLGSAVTFEEAVMALRIISATASALTVLVMFRVLEFLEPKNISKATLFAVSLLFVFSPALIQFSHFGTTESLLMLLFSLLVAVSLAFLKKKRTLREFIYLSSIIGGLAVAIKISSVSFMIIPVMALVIYLHEHKTTLGLRLLVLLEFGAFTAVVACIFSPQNLLSTKEFIGSLTYETEVARGMPVFYTRSFFQTTPLLYQLRSVFPYALGLPVSALFLISFFVLPYNKITNFLRLSFLAYVIPASFLFTKWTRFMAPVIPLMLIFSALLLVFYSGKTKGRSIILWILVLISIVPGIAYMNIYMRPDVRETASIWIARNVPDHTRILSETANVVDIPLPTQTVGKTYDVTSFNFYELDENPLLIPLLENKLNQSEYILIPSRRIFANHTCIYLDRNSEKCKELQSKYPALNKYYDKLFSGQLGFTEVAKFSSYPQILLGGKAFFEIPDEQAEETWTVFDHPVIRVYKKIKKVDF